MHTLSALSLRYDASEDRILAAINAGQVDSWACWLTRRMSLAILEKVRPHLDKTSSLVSRVPLEHQDAAATMQREVALASTRSAMSKTDDRVLGQAAAGAELGTELQISPQGADFVLRITGQRGGQTQGILKRAQLQTILQMLEHEVTKASWAGGVVPPVQGASTVEPNRNPRAN